MGQIDDSLAGFEVPVEDAIAVDILQSHGGLCDIHPHTYIHLKGQEEI